MKQKPEEKRRNGGYEIYPAGEKEKAENRVAKVYYLPALRGHGDCVLHLRPQIHDDRARGAGRRRTDRRRTEADGFRHAAGNARACKRCDNFRHGDDRGDPGGHALCHGFDRG